ncbi:MAG: sigma-54-dependent Fis family transcriptional regulator [Myxococcales bacterium]|nr:sigma-54-dependent Fis family transcriptional regulator [Myxococcales bacterium]
MEHERKLSLLVELGSMLAQTVELDALLGRIGARVAACLRAERASVFLVDSESGDLRSRVADVPGLGEIRVPPGRGVAGWVAAHGRAVNIRNVADDHRHFREVDRATGFTTRSLLCVPIVEARGTIRGVLQALNKHDGPFDDDDEVFLQTIAQQVSLALRLTTLRPARDETPGVQLRGVFNHIIGTSAAMRQVSEAILRAAQTQATVLLRGETGCGKGLFAQCLHANGRRSAGPMVTVDCTTLPAALAESELFGHERGAFTGADRRVIGKVERAHGGTLFLDEIGDLPLAVQAKLLRVLQERCFERLGGRETHRVDLRVIAATHRDLAAMVTRGEFRQDLYFRLKVIEIALPSLRARGPDELVALAEHFLRVYTLRHTRGPMQLSAAALAALCAHPWPGNVRELEHAIERAVVVCPDDLIGPEHLGLPIESRGSAPAPHPSADQFVAPVDLTLDALERRYIAETLARCQGNVSHAAARLGITRATLRRKLGPPDAGP